MKALLVLIFLLPLLHSCLGTPRSTRTSQALGNIDSEDNDFPAPSFENTRIFWETLGVTYDSRVNISTQDKRVIKLRGEAIDSYIRANQPTTISCALFSFPTSVDNKSLALGLTARESIDTVNKTREFYFEVAINDSLKTSSSCLNTEISALSTSLLPGATISYTLEGLCPNCSTSILSGTFLGLFTKEGETLQSFPLSHLTLEASTGGGTTTPGIGQCVSNSQCSDFDCCHSSGACVNNGTLRPSATSHPDYVQAMNLISGDSTKKLDYPYLFYFCPGAGDGEDDDNEDDDPLKDAELVRIEQTELYNCTTPTDGESGVCTISYEDYSNTTLTSFATGLDDLSYVPIYSGTTLAPTHSLTSVLYAESELVEGTDYSVSAPSINDNLTTSTEITTSFTPSTTPYTDVLKLKFRVNATCRQTGTTYATCKKIYIQGQDASSVMDHTTNATFDLPEYASNRTPKVFVDGTEIPLGANWTFTFGPPSDVTFTGLTVQDGQRVEILFYIDTSGSSFEALFPTLDAAIKRVETMCSCSGDDCALTPLYNDDGSLERYACPPQVSPDDGTLAVSARSAPMRYFDVNGLSVPTPDTSSLAQEGTLFEYTGFSSLAPNNFTAPNTEIYIGPQEVYGTLNVGPTSASAPATLEVEEGQTYNIFTNNSGYSNCTNCGQDYFNNLLTAFPTIYNPGEFGGGVIPSLETTSSSNQSIRAHDLLYGRACFVPMTMIPWSHTTSIATTKQSQRQHRETAQHFLYANGLQRDWYGFDYGALIGSFDGVKWFAVGSKRQIQATSNRLFLAINAPLSDLASSDSYEVQVVEAAGGLDENDIPKTDYETNGAQCQQYHQCNTDRDCAAQLGPEYACESVASLKTTWPNFGTNAEEIYDSTQSLSLTSLFKQTAGLGPNRCIYRGRGAPCLNNYTGGGANYADTTNPKALACAPNYYCADITADSVFNLAINRINASVFTQNQSVAAGGVLRSRSPFGLHAPLTGRPFNYKGVNTVPMAPINIQSILTTNSHEGLCMPGARSTDSSYTNLNSNAPTAVANEDYAGDRVNGLGVTLDTAIASADFYKACGAFDTSGNYVSMNASFDTAGAEFTSAQVFTSAQNTTSRVLMDFQNYLGVSETSEDAFVRYFTDGTNEEVIENLIHENNRCLKVRGETCFTQYECSAGEHLSGKLALLDPDSFTLSNYYQAHYLKEGLICSQEKRPGEEGFSLSDNRCCRDLGKDILIPSSDLVVDLYWSSRSPGDDYAVDTSDALIENYYTPSKMLKQLESEDSILYKPIIKALNSSEAIGTDIDLDSQYETFNALATRSCCSGDWIRNFHTSNGGGHNWSASRLQPIPRSQFRCYNWLRCSGGVSSACPDPTAFNCSHAVGDPSTDPNCLLVSHDPNSGVGQKILQELSKSEFAGIPQLYIEDPNVNLTCNSDLDSQEDAGIIPELIFGGIAAIDYTKGGVNQYGLDPNDDTLNGTEIKTAVFSEDKFSCCKAAGKILRDDEDDSMCCTGQVKVLADNSRQCALPDFSDLTVYTNRYVSSAAKDLSSTLFDASTGNLKSINKLAILACESQICASGHVAAGVAISELPYHGKGSTPTLLRFVDGDAQANTYKQAGDLFDKGLKWNNHLYCAPDPTAQGISNDDLAADIINCEDII